MLPLPMSGLLLLLFLLLGRTDAILTLRDARTVAIFEDDSGRAAAFGTLTVLAPATAARPLLPLLPVPPDPQPPLWTAHLVFDGGRPATDIHASDTVAQRTVNAVSDTSALFIWTVPVAGTSLVDGCPPLVVSVQVDLQDGLLEFSTKFSQPSNTSTATTDTLCDVGLWSWVMRPLVAPATTGVFEPHGFGVVHPSPAAGFQFSGEYPQQTMQFMAAFNGSTNTAFYVAAHDPTAASKGFGCNVVAPGVAVFSVSAVPENAGLPLSAAPGGCGPAWPIVVAPYESATTIDWWGAADLYRRWALPHAQWTTQGPLAQRDDVPAWAMNLTVWVNSHWQPNDIFNVSGGAPHVVEQRVSAIKDRFALGEDVELGFHWYEWDKLGYIENYTKCSSEITCGFDTHYPEYFPARGGFKSALVSLQQRGVRVCPYVNGRIFDQGTKTWRNDPQAAGAAAKSAQPTLYGQTGLALYNESYGSKARFAVMCPHTAYWQGTMADVVGNLTRDKALYGTDGVYVDQVAAAGPRPCWDASHGHALGGGNHWVTGYLDMLGEMRRRAGNDKLLLTESNAEPFMSELDMFLTLVGFGGGALSPPPPSHAAADRVGDDAKYIVPAFQSVYGGWVLFMGAEFFMADFLPNPNIFAAKCAAQLLFGAQIGWFSLGGRTNIDNPSPLFNLLMDDSYNDEVDYLRTLSNAKRAAQEFLVHGRAGRFIERIIINGTNMERRVARDHPRYTDRNQRKKEGESGGKNDIGDNTVADLYFAPVMTGTWLAADGKSLLVIMTTIERDAPATAHATLDMRQFGFGAQASDEMFDLWTFPVDGGSPAKVGTFKGNAVQVKAVLGARAVSMMRVIKTDPEIEK